MIIFDPEDSRKAKTEIHFFNGLSFYFLRWVGLWGTFSHICNQDRLQNAREISGGEGSWRLLAL
jgi:hypothetical protein